jgi:hypothetical protein
MITFKTFLTGIFWWMYVATEKYILEQSAFFSRFAEGSTMLNSVGIVGHFISIFFISGFFTLIVFRHRQTNLTQVLLFAIAMCAVSSTLDFFIGATLLYEGSLASFVQWYVVGGYAVCILSCLLFARRIPGLQKH